jgi:DNA-binding NarL/FixJ family response regulator
MKRLMIVADHSFVVQAIRLALRQTAGFQVVGFFDGRGSVRHALQELRPDVVLVDDMQEADNALARLREITEEAPQAKALLLTLQMDSDWLEEAFEAGAHADVVHRYEKRRVAVVEEDCPLTDRELEILKLVSEGHTNGRIARELWVTEQTVKFHLSNTYRKLGVANRTEASRYAHLHNLTAPRERLAS